ncbi:hypothetical protein [Hymenobacter koreensis]|uniref:hypothetical protein n=1 Tax=Hymenobacter koreensis TaxID=1084523 RepID=UPI0031ECA4C4
MANATEHCYALANPSFGNYAVYFEATASNNFGGLPVQVHVLARPALDRYLAKLLSMVQHPKVFGWLQRLQGWLPGRRRLPQLMYLDDAQTFDLNEHGYLRAARERVVLLHGWCFRDRTNISKHAPLIRDLFRLVEPHRQAVDALVQKCRAHADVLVGVHLRRGDYATFNNGKYYYDNATYARVMRELQAQFPQPERVAFVLCSDEPLDLSAFAGLPVHLANNHVVEDLYTLAASDYVVGPPSSYSMWASFYGQVPLLHLETAEQPVPLAQFRVFTDE